MRYDLSKEKHRDRFKKVCNTFFAKQWVVELSRVMPRRSPQQNRYLHLLLSVFAAAQGERLDYVKEYYYKRNINRDLFVRTIQDPYFGTMEVLRSSADLTKDEMSLSIDRFKEWVAQNTEVLLPDNNEAEMAEAYHDVVLPVLKYL